MVQLPHGYCVREPEEIGDTTLVVPDDTGLPALPTLVAGPVEGDTTVCGTLGTAGAGTGGSFCVWGLDGGR